MVETTLLEAAWQSAIQEEKVIFGALKQAHVWRRRPDYEDLVQEGYLVYVQTYLQYRPAHKTFDQRSFNIYAFQAICWHVRNLLRRHLWLTERSELSLDAPGDSEFCAVTHPFPERQSVIWTDLQKTQMTLTKRQRQVLYQHLILGQPLQTLAQQLKVSVRTLRTDRQKIISRVKMLQ